MNAAAEKPTEEVSAEDLSSSGPPFETITQAVQYYSGEKGYTAEQISRFGGYDLVEVRAELKRLSVGGGNFATQTQALKMAGMLFDPSMTYEDIGRAFGITKQAIEKFRRKGEEFGIPFPARDEIKDRDLSH